MIEDAGKKAGNSEGEPLYFCMASSRISGLDLIKVK